ncbi:MAG: pectinesterase family protein [Muribaculum sp.]|nr:pectinesterase family protein [Muribaculum sp.]
MRKLFSSTLMLVLSMLPCVNIWAADSDWTHIETERSWDLTKGSNHANEVTDCEYWSASSKGRYSLAKALDNQELPSNTGGALSGLEGLYFTVASGAVYGISGNYCFQNGKMTVRIPNCGKNDELIIDFSGAGGDASVSSDNITSTLTMPSSVSKQCDESKVKTRVKENGDVILEMSCGKGFRLYGISVIPHDPNAPLDINVTYFNTDGSVIGTDVVPEGETLIYKYGVSDVTIPEGQVFRGWFANTKSTAVKVAEGTALTTDTELHARATAVEEPTATSRFVYDLTKEYFYAEDHEAIEIDGSYYNNHGWLINNNGTIKVKVAGKCYVSIGCCLYSKESTAVVTDEACNVVAEFPVKAESDGAEQTFQYDGEAGWLTITFPEGSYTHSVTVSNVVDFVEYDEASGYYEIPAGDVSSFLIALSAAASQDGAKIFLPNGTYDLGTTVLTPIAGKNISIIGESREGTVILNYPPLEGEGISLTATLLNRSENLYLQDLTLRNAMPFDGKAAAGRAVTLQDKGKNTICKNVSLESYQDTYYSNNNSAYFYFEDGEIHGVVDYVCGGGDVYFNHVKFVNEAVKNATMAAPNGAKKYGYVMNNCTIETLCSQFNFGRSWGAYSGLAWINTTINQPSKIESTRFKTTGMNCSADKFVEFNSVDADGNVVTPASNVLKFTHSSGDKEYETVLTAEEAAEYAIEKVFPDWRPEEIAAQVVYEENEDVTNNTYLVDGKIIYGDLPTGITIMVRKANSRGGFGPAVEVNRSSGVDKIGNEETNVVNTQYYNMQGLVVDASYKGMIIKVETLESGKKATSKIINE